MHKGSLSRRSGNSKLDLLEVSDTLQFLLVPHTYNAFNNERLHCDEYARVLSMQYSINRLMHCKRIICSSRDWFNPDIIQYDTSLILCQTPHE